MRARRGAGSHSEIVFRGVMLALVAGVIYGWCGPEFERTVGAPAIDMDGAVAPERALALLAEYGAEGRKRYLAFLSLDCLMPVAGSLVLVAVYDAISRSGALSRAKSRALGFIGALPAICDLTENTLYALLASLYPRHAEPLAELAYLATLAKLGSSALALAMLGVVVMLWLKRQRARPEPDRRGL